MKKILILIKSHDKRFADYHNSLYEELESINFKHLSNQAQVDFYYIKGNSTQDELVTIDQDGKNIWIKTKENYSDGSAIKDKVLSSLDFLLNEQNKDYSHVFVVNLSTIVNTSMLMKEISQVDDNECAAYLGMFIWNGEHYVFPSGAGYLMSINLAKRYLSHSKSIDHSTYPCHGDDVFLGLSLKRMGCKLKAMPRPEITQPIIGNLSEHSKKVIKSHAHIRVKFTQNRNEEALLHKKIYESIYDQES